MSGRTRYPTSTPTYPGGRRPAVVGHPAAAAAALEPAAVQPQHRRAAGGRVAGGPVDVEPQLDRVAAVVDGPAVDHVLDDVDVAEHRIEVAAARRVRWPEPEGHRRPARGSRRPRRPRRSRRPAIDRDLLLPARPEGGERVHPQLKPAIGVGRRHLSRWPHRSALAPAASHTLTRTSPPGAKLWPRTVSSVTSSRPAVGVTSISGVGQWAGRRGRTSSAAPGSPGLVERLPRPGGGDEQARRRRRHGNRCAPGRR